MYQNMLLTHNVPLIFPTMIYIVLLAWFSRLLAFSLSSPNSHRDGDADDNSSRSNNKKKDEIS